MPPLRILVVEDNPRDTELMLRELRRAGFENPEWLRVESETDYLDHLHADLDIILSDFQMPRFNGLRALELLKERKLDIPFILISGTIGEDIAVQAMKQGAADYLLKDRLARLGSAIQHALEESRLRRERKAAWETLQLRETALNEVSQGVLICDEKRLITYANTSFTRITGYPLGEVMGRKCAFLQGPDTDPGTNQKIRTALADGRPFDGEILNYRKDGEPFWNELSISPIRSECGGPLRFIGIQRDVTARKRAGEALQKSEEEVRKDRALLRTLIDSIPDLIFFKDENSRFLGFNKAFEEQFGFTEKNLLGLTDYDIAPRELAESHLRKDRELFASGQPQRTEDWIPYHSGGGGFFETVKTPYYGPDGKSLGLVGVSRNITERKQAEDRLAAALVHEKELTEKARAGDRAKSEFLAVMSHEVRTPMNGIIGFAGLLLQSPLSPECHAYAQTIVQSGEALIHVLDDILDFSRLEAGGLKVADEVFSPLVLLEDIHRLMAPQATEKDVEVRLEIAPSIPGHLRGDAGRLRQILLNLVGNAIKFTVHGSISITLKPLPDQPSTFVFAVRDTGVGITPEQMGRIFQPFTQADSSISRKYGGTGLGLTISRRLAELLGGELSVKSEPGRGSEFFLTLPLAIGDKAREEPSPARGDHLNADFADTHPLKILVVEDDRTNLKLIQALLRRLGYAPLAAENGVEATAVFQEENPDCILMDLQMPEMDGIEATVMIRALEKSRNRPAAFISALTANIFPADRQRCFEAGMDAYLNKPVRIAALADILRNACQARNHPGRAVSPGG